MHTFATRASLGVPLALAATGTYSGGMKDDIVIRLASSDDPGVSS